MSARVSSAVLDLNEALSWMGQDQESALAESSVSTIRSEIFNPVEKAVEKSRTWVLTNTDDIVNDPVTVEERNIPPATSEAVSYSTRTRAACPSEGLLREQVLSTSNDLLKWFVVLESVEELSSQDASVYLAEVEGCFTRYKDASDHLSNYHIRHGEIEQYL